MMHTWTHDQAGSRRLRRLAGIQMLAGHDDLSLRSTLADLKAELEQVDRMIRVLEWAAARPGAHEA